MSRFKESQFKQIIQTLNDQEFEGENIWISVGILEYMYDDDCGYLDNYFHTELSQRIGRTDELWNNLQNHLKYI